MTKTELSIGTLVRGILPNGGSISGTIVELHEDVCATIEDPFTYDSEGGNRWTVPLADVKPMGPSAIQRWHQDIAFFGLDG